jgi:nitrogen-specific signal transduction histidine kinase
VGKGTGIGLSLSATIVHQHNGHLALDTTKSNTCFVVEIPLNIDTMPSSLKKGAA